MPPSLDKKEKPANEKPGKKNKPYKCHHPQCPETFDALPDENEGYLTEMGHTAILVECPGCQRTIALDIADEATLLDGGQNDVGE